MQIYSMVVALFHTPSGEYLLQNRGEGEEHWAFLGGGIEEGEEPLQALIREMQEEVGFLIDHTDGKFTYLDFDDVPFSEGKVMRCHFFKIPFPGFEHFSDSDEVRVSDLRLFTITEMKQLNAAKALEFYLSNPRFSA